jgi:phosphatidylglycerol:prolipoprotein diacylglycerol transferase
MTIHRRGIEIGPIDLLGVTINPTFHFYGLIIVAGILLAAAVAAWMARRDDKDPDHVWNGLIWVVLLGVVFARAWHVLFPSINSARDRAWYFEHFFDLNEGPLVLWSGGLSIFGAVLGGALGIAIYAYRNKLDFFSWLDIGAVVVPLGQAIGRWGNYVNEELFGKPTDLPWGMTLTNPPPEFAPDTRFHPIFLYESQWNLLAFGVLLWLWLRYRDRMKTGDFLLLYLVLYGIVRFLLEYLRVDVTLVNGVNVSQVTTAVTGIVALVLLIVRHRDLLRGRTRSTQRDAAETARRS